MGRFAQNESEMSESNESLGGRGCRTNRELALLRTTRDSTSSHFKHLNKPTVKLGYYYYYYYYYYGDQCYVTQRVWTRYGWRNAWVYACE